jgi:fatty-acid desaturase
LDPLLQRLDLVVRGFGVVVAVWGGFVLAAYGAFLSAYRIGATLVPLALPLVVVGNAGLIWFAYRVTGHKLLGLSPGIVWILVTFVWSTSTSEGDLVLYQKNWVATAYLLAGSATVGLYAYRLVVPKRGG